MTERTIKKEIEEIYNSNFKNYISGNRKKVIGIIGGLGPEASIDLEKEILNLTPSSKDQDSFRVIHFSNPALPDRTLALKRAREGNLELAEKLVKEVNEMLDIFLNLKDYHCSTLIMPCNSLFCFFDDVKTEKGEVRGIKSYLKSKNSDCDVLNIVEETAKFAEKYLPHIGKFGLLATDSTIGESLYQDSFGKLGKEVIIPDRNVQDELIMPAIYKIKGKEGKEAERLLLKGVSHLKEKGAEMIILGCTEIPLVLKGKDFIASNSVLAAAAIKSVLK